MVCVHDRRSHWTELHRGLLYKMQVIDTFGELKMSVEIHILRLNIDISPEYQTSMSTEKKLLIEFQLGTGNEQHSHTNLTSPILTYPSQSNNIDSVNV